MEHTVQALPQISTLQLHPGDRAIGRLTSLNLPSKPNGQAVIDLAGDTFFEYFQSQPQARADVPAERSTNRQLLDWVRSTHGWEQARTATTGNLPASATAAAFMTEYLQTDDAMKEALNQQEKAEAKAEQARNLQQRASAEQMAAQIAGQMGEKDAAAEHQTNANDLLAQAEALMNQSQAHADKASEVVDKAQQSTLRQASMNAAARQAAEKGKEVAEAMSGWGMGPGSVTQYDPANALEFLKKNTGNVAKIARLAGRMRGFAMSAKASKVPMLTGTEVGLTANLLRVFPTELALLHPSAPASLRAEQMGRLVETGLLGYRPQNDGEERGPFVAAVDDSPSMWGARQVVAKAIALGVAQTAKSEGRPYYLISFASDPDTVTVISDKDSWQDHIAWASASQSGGTDFDMALQLAMGLLGDLDKADCLFISDGEAGVSRSSADAWRLFSADHGARLFYVPVGSGGMIDIERLADRVFQVGDLDEETGANLSSELGRWM